MKTEIEKKMSELRGYEADGQRKELLREWAHENGYDLDVTGDACRGDEVVFARAVFSGRYPNSRFAGVEIIEGLIYKDSYGERKGQHTFTIAVNCDGGKMIRIKGRNLYSIGCFARSRDRAGDLHEKHQRGDSARKAKAARIEREEDYIAELMAEY